MFARSTAWRHGEGRTSSTEVSISWSRPIDDEQVRRLEVAVRQARVPELADEVQPLVDEVVVHLGVPQGVRAGEELGDEQVLAARA